VETAHAIADPTDQPTAGIGNAAQERRRVEITLRGLLLIDLLIALILASRLPLR